MRLSPFSCALLIGGLFSSARASTVPASGWSLRYQPARIVNGSPIVFRVRTPKTVRSLSGSWLGHDLAFSFDTKEKTWFALAGASLETKAGVYSIELRGETPSGQGISYEKKITVQLQRYPRVILKVPGKYTAPSAEEQKEIDEDKKIKEEAFKTLSPNRDWEGSFLAAGRSRNFRCLRSAARF